MSQHHSRKPFGLQWRASCWLTTLVVGCGIAIDLLVYSIIIPVIPFQLEALGYSNVSSRTGWLLFAYSGGLLISTIPIAQITEKYNARRWPLIIGFALLIASQVLFMEAPNYAIMCVARVVQGIGSSIVWVVGLALLADAAPEELVGRQLGLAMIGFNVGLVLGPPLGSALYDHFGFRGPFIFGMIASLLDLLGRALVIERKEAIPWGFDPKVVKPVQDHEETKPIPTVDGEKAEGPLPATSVHDPSGAPQSPQITLLTVVRALGREPRAIITSIIVLFYGILLSSLEPALPLHLAEVYHLSTGKVGLVFIAGAVPAFISTPLAGYLTDTKGAEFIAPAFLLLAVPWAVVLLVESHLALFIVSFGVFSFFLHGVVSPLTAELAAVARKIDGVGYGHVYGAFNLAYGMGSTVGPVVGGQMYDHLEKGWMAISLLAAGLIALGSLLTFACTGERPLLHRVLGRSSRTG
ncbi:major facilitator superfamily domain-containing protein [Coprinopsis sp. MPI-PUGE-AT-0042]|nr:major facilitator superfamily domain-containing protein [Coprinopsis sp. MPI-PUGE-AT-0042]